MFRTSRRSSVVIAVLALAFPFAGGGAAAAPLPSTIPAQALSSGFRALTGAEAAAFTVPGDMELVRTMQLPAYDLAYERYQQFFGPVHAEVLGAQVTLYRDPAGTIRTVIGSHYPKIAPTNAIGLTKAVAAAVADRDIGPGGDRRVDLLIEPASGRYFYRVETRRLDSRWFHWVDAVNGQLLNRYDGIANDHGTGVKSDTKDINGPDNVNTADDLTTFHNASGHGASGLHWDLFSTDNRQKTYDARNGTTFAYYTTDLDNHWDLVTSTRKSPGQPALVDAQFYANATDDYYQSRHTFDWLGCYPSAMQSVAHYSRNYNNAFWNGTYTIYGDGDGVSFREFSGALDVVAHEQTHGVTDCTSNLVYQDESGALNESFSDQMGNAAEFFAAEPTATNCVLASGQSACADWWIGEDVYLPADTVPGFRNMKDPEEDGDPDHYTERQIGGGDNGGVHSNSGIPNHAFYLLVNGGQNAGCDGVGSNGHTHTANCDVTVPSIGLFDAERIFFLGLTSLQSNATMCDARGATVAQASLLGTVQVQATGDAWTAVGVTSALCGGTNTPPTADNKAAATNEDTPVLMTLTGSDAETCELTFSIVTPPSNGLLSAISNAICTSGSPNTDSATVTYTPNANFNGSDSFTYKVNDGAADSPTATVSVTVSAVNDPPAAADKSVTTTKDTNVTATLTAADVDNCELTFAIVSGPAHGSLGGITAASCTTGNPNSDSATVSYSPAVGYTGSDSLTYKANDGAADSNIATISITVSETATGDPNDMYVWDIAFESRTRGKGGSKHDERIAVTVRRDSDADGVAEATDALVPSASVLVTVVGPSGFSASFSGTSDSAGVFRTAWMWEPAIGTYTAEVTGLTHASYVWDQSLDPTSNDTDLYPANNRPEQQHTIPH